MPFEWAGCRHVYESDLDSLSATQGQRSAREVSRFGEAMSILDAVKRGDATAWVGDDGRRGLRRRHCGWPVHL